MRFFEPGPSIPDELLIARDEGRVVFFCGAGVSRARAGLPDFLGLVEQVVQRLGVSADSLARTVLDKTREIHNCTGIDGLISADRIFGLLEREFDDRDIEAEVAKALRPVPKVDLSAHRMLLDLATTPEGQVRLVTTNFDRLFERGEGELPVWQPPRLPDPSRPEAMDGIIYLHGCVDKAYRHAEGEGLILSSAAFGRAYLSEGWATAFFREIIERYRVVFVGYAADDPPIQYLLEALNKRAGQLTGVYAFQAGASDKAAARWRYRGVEAIAYPETDGHSALWDTLEAWAARARAPEAWHQSVIDLARKGPRKLRSHERGQVAHLVSTAPGACQFSQADPPPPAEWLCVFDPARRYAPPELRFEPGTEGAFVDPFDRYGLDSDRVPEKEDSEEFSLRSFWRIKRNVPSDAGDVLTANRLDRQTLQEAHFPAFRGYGATHIPELTPRLKQIGRWLSRVAEQPAAVWWAAHQAGLYPELQQRIQWALEDSSKAIPPAIRWAWRYLFEAWEATTGEPPHHSHRLLFYHLKDLIKKEGWDSAAVRKYASLKRPHVRARPRGDVPPEEKTDLRVGDLVWLSVEYPALPEELEIPNAWLVLAVRELRKNLEQALLLENELGGFGLMNLSPLVPDDSPDIDRDARLYGLSGHVIAFASLLERLIEKDAEEARRELASWPADDDTIFARLRIWAGGKGALISAPAFGRMVMDLSDEAFWDEYHQRDLLRVLAKRWQELGEEPRQAIEARLLQGPKSWDGEEESRFRERRAWAILDRLTWLANQGGGFSFDLELETAKLKQEAPRWTPAHGAKAAESWESRGGVVQTDTDCSALRHEPLSSVLSKAHALSGRGEDFFIQKDPFAGLCLAHPIRAFSALAQAARNKEYPAREWHTFLNSEARKRDRPRFSALIAERLALYPDESLMDFIDSVASWVLNVSESLASHSPETFERIITKLINLFRTHPPGNCSPVIRSGNEPDWAEEALNAPVGKIVRALFNDPRINGLKAGSGWPAEWLAHVEGLLALDGDPRRHALVFLGHQLPWFYARDPGWTETHLLSVLDGEEREDRDAFWSGFFVGANIPNPELYRRLKSNLLVVAKEQRLLKQRYSKKLAGILLAGWGNKEEKTQQRFISNEEMREVILKVDDEFRTDILWQLRIWTKYPEWSEQLPAFLQAVWPRQKWVKTSTVSARLCELALADIKHFSTLAEIIWPFLTPIDRAHFLIREFQKIINCYPQQSLALLEKILPDEVTAWPYGIGKVLQQIGEADSRLNSDSRLWELKRKWNAR